MEFSKIAALSGKSGLFRVVSPTRSGVILEALDDSKQRIMACANAKVSVLSEISIYSVGDEESVPLIKILKNIHESYNGDTGIDKNATPDELKAFFKTVLADYDEDRVYVSDIKKVAMWYQKLVAIDPQIIIKAEIESSRDQIEEPS